MGKTAFALVQGTDGESFPSSPSQQGRELKGLYRDQYSELQMVKAEADYTQKLVEQCTQELVMEFQEWYASLPASIFTNALPFLYIFVSGALAALTAHGSMQHKQPRHQLQVCWRHCFLRYPEA